MPDVNVRNPTVAGIGFVPFTLSNRTLPCDFGYSNPIGRGGRPEPKPD